MKKISTSKLTLKTETIKQLDSMQMKEVAGGISITCLNCTTSHYCVSVVVQCPATYTCPTISNNCVTTAC